jgi:lipoyl(octanoyl) transferase
MHRVCQFTYLGLVPYQEARELQEQLAGEIAQGLRSATLLLLEHPHTYTFGRSGNAENLLWDEAQLNEKGISVHWVDRGGDVTYHGPGQLVGYPLLPLGKPGTLLEGDADSMHLPQVDYIEYLRKLESALIVSLADIGISGEQLPGLTGVWVTQPTPLQTSDPSLLVSLHPAKIASIGVKVDGRGVSRHGFALNVKPDMSYWQGIIACGLEGYPETSLAELLSPSPAIEEVIESVVSAFGKEFDFTMQSARL